MNRLLNLFHKLFQLQCHQEVSRCPDVNPRNSLHAGNVTCKKGTNPGFNTQGRHHQKCKRGVSLTQQKDFCPPKFVLKRSSNYHCGQLCHVCTISFIDQLFHASSKGKHKRLDGKYIEMKMLHIQICFIALQQLYEK